MCKFIKDIFYPFNIFGKKIRTFTLPQTHPPYNNYDYYIEWKGDRLDCVWTKFRKDGGRTVHTEQRETFIDADYREDHLEIRQSLSPTVWVSDLYLKCTNVTYLVVNGETLIDEE